jgi:Mg2+/Co2+ transporter CorB
LKFKQQVEQQAIDAQIRAKKDAAEALARKGYAPLPEEERVRILQGLKVNLEKVTFEYGKISMVVDTIGKIRRLVSMEDFFDFSRRNAKPTATGNKVSSLK